MTPLAPLTKQIFKSFGLVLPEGAVGRPSQTFPGDDATTEQDPRWLFVPASDLALHAKTVRIVSAMLAAFIDDMSQGICHAWNDWKRSATFANVVVNAGVGILPPSGLVSPPLMTKAIILSYMKLDDRFELYRAYGEAIAGALEQAWSAWASSYTHLSLPFPGSAVIGPVPPNPNVPMPLATGMSPGDALMTPGPLASTMNALFGRPGNHASFLFQAFSISLPQIFNEWKASNLITNVMASGGAGMPAMGALGMGGMISGPDVMAQPEGWKTKLDELKEKLQNIPKPKEIIANAVSSAIHNIKEELLDKLPDLPGKPSLPGLPSLPTLPGIPSKPSIPKPGGGGPGQGGHTPPGQGGHTPPGQGGHTPPGQGGHTPPGQGGHTPPGQGGHTPPGQGGHTPPGQGGHTPPGQGNGSGHGGVHAFPGQEGGSSQGGHTAPGKPGGLGEGGQPLPGQSGGSGHGGHSAHQGGSSHGGHSAPGTGDGPGPGAGTPQPHLPGQTQGAPASPEAGGGHGPVDTSSGHAGEVPGGSAPAPAAPDPLDFSKPPPSAPAPSPEEHGAEGGSWVPIHSAPASGGAIGGEAPALSGRELETSLLVGDLGWNSPSPPPGNAPSGDASRPTGLRG